MNFESLRFELMKMVNEAELAGFSTALGALWSR